MVKKLPPKAVNLSPQVVACACEACPRFRSSSGERGPLIPNPNRHSPINHSQDIKHRLSAVAGFYVAPVTT